MPLVVASKEIGLEQGPSTFTCSRAKFYWQKKIMGHIHVLQSKVCILLQGMPTNISPHKHTKIVLLFYLFIYD
jgi:hypothetical protein